MRKVGLLALVPVGIHRYALVMDRLNCSSWTTIQQMSCTQSFSVKMAADTVWVIIFACKAVNDTIIMFAYEAFIKSIVVIID